MARNDGICSMETEKNCGIKYDKGYEVRRYHGWARKGTEYHAWCEYYDTKREKWIVIDSAQWIVNDGYSHDELGYIVDYWLEWKVPEDFGKETYE